MIRVRCPYIVTYIVHIVNTCIVTHTFPYLCNHAIVIPLPKIENPESHRDLRPINQNTRKGDVYTNN